MACLIDCECLTWASTDMRRRLLGGGHHENCVHFSVDSTIVLLEELVQGIQDWAYDADGVHPDIEKAYVKAYSIVHGRKPELN